MAKLKLVHSRKLHENAKRLRHAAAHLHDGIAAHATEHDATLAERRVRAGSEVMINAGIAAANSQVQGTGQVG